VKDGRLSLLLENSSRRNCPSTSSISAAVLPLKVRDLPGFRRTKAEGEAGEGFELGLVLQMQRNTNRALQSRDRRVAGCLLWIFVRKTIDGGVPTIRRVARNTRDIDFP